MADFRDQAYVFQIWRVADFGFESNVNRQI